MGNKKYSWVKIIMRMFSGKLVEIEKVGDFAKQLNDFNQPKSTSLQTDVIAMVEWEDKIEEALKMIDVSLYSESVNRAKIMAAI